MLHLVTTADGLAACLRHLRETDTVMVIGTALTAYAMTTPHTTGRVLCFEADAERLGIESIEPISYTEWVSMLFEQPVQTWS
jgi:hypothetical protein